MVDIIEYNCYAAHYYRSCTNKGFLSPSGGKELFAM